jgi:predicted enzyme related to lactoylglutathione lyase
VTKIGSAFLPVKDPAAASAWFNHAFDLKEYSLNAWAAVLVDTEGNRLTLLGPASGIQAQPGLPWATHNLVVDNLEATHARMLSQGRAVTLVTGDPEVCRFFSMRDPDGNVLLVCDR